MRVEDVLRKIRLLRRLVPENGASEFEAKTANRLVQALMERYSIGKVDAQSVPAPSNRMTWVYWEQLLAEFRIRLDRFGGRASAKLGNDTRVLIHLASGQWHLQHTSREGWKTTVREFGLESLRAYLTKYRRSYSLANQEE
jgi:hypothetical protein